MFFITGLPRSRTKWMSVYLGMYPGVICAHELLRYCSSRHQFYKAMETGAMRKGNADSGLFVTDFQARWPDAPTVIIERDPDDVWRSLEAIGHYLDKPTTQWMEQGVASVKGLRVPFGLLDAEMPAIHEYIGVPYNQDIHDNLQFTRIVDNNIDVHPDALRIWLEEDR